MQADKLAKLNTGASGGAGLTTSSIMYQKQASLTKAKQVSNGGEPRNQQMLMANSYANIELDQGNRQNMLAQPRGQRVTKSLASRRNHHNIAKHPTARQMLLTPSNQTGTYFGSGVQTVTNLMVEGTSGLRSA